MDKVRSPDQTPPGNTTTVAEACRFIIVGRVIGKQTCMASLTAQAESLSRCQLEQWS